MSSTTSDNSPALEMARCPNCDYVVEQLGTRTSCGKCGKRLTIHCIVCQTNNPPIFQFCLKCGSDFRLYAVEHYSKQLAKVEFDLRQYERLTRLKLKAAAFEEIGKFAFLVFTTVIGLFCWFAAPTGLRLALLLCLPLLIFLLARLCGQRLLFMLVGMPRQAVQEWRQICLSAERQKAQRLELQEQLGYYQQELNHFRQRATANRARAAVPGTTPHL